MKEEAIALMEARCEWPKHDPANNQFVTVRVSQRLFDYLDNQRLITWSGDWPMFVGVSLMVDDYVRFAEKREWLRVETPG